MTAGPRTDRVISSLRNQRKCMVVVGHPVDDAGLLRVDVHNCAGSVLAVAHLLRLGRHRVGFVGATGEHVFGAQRLDGYRQAIAADGRESDGRLVRLDQPTVDGGYRATMSLLAEQPDATHVSTDSMAVGAYRALREHGLRIPDVAVVGFDGLPRGPVLDPVLTTVVQPVLDVGQAAVELLAGGATNHGWSSCRRSCESQRPMGQPVSDKLGLDFSRKDRIIARRATSGV